MQAVVQQLAEDQHLALAPGLERVLKNVGQVGLGQRGENQLPLRG